MLKVVALNIILAGQVLVSWCCILMRKTLLYKRQPVERRNKMKFDERYEMQIVVIEDLGNGMTGDCYDNVTELKKEKPHADYLFAYIVYDTVEKTIPPGCSDWNDSPEDALYDYQDNVLCEDKNENYDCYTEIIKVIENHPNYKEDGVLGKLKDACEQIRDKDDVAGMIVILL
jgi:hypothetical protein